ncbi:MAG: prephenate dehydrogenase/arogenate dehydrogenase family protein [Pseudomonadota bacterium]
MNKTLSIGIIGGTGGMGRWFEKFYSAAGHRVLISGRTTDITYTDVAKECDVVILSVPLDAAVSISKDIGPLLSDDQLFMDMCSLKEEIVKSMTENTKADVLGTHPLFGPFTDSIKGQNIILCPGRGERWLKWIGNEYASRGAILCVMGPLTHDRHMAVVQGLTHFTTICMARTLQKMDMNSDNVLSCSTPVFKINYNLIGRLFAQDLDLYKNLISKNKHFKEVLEVFISAMDESNDALLSGQDERAILFMETIREFFKDTCKDALKESNKIINTLYS